LSFNTLVISLKKSFYKIKRGSLGLAERGKVSRKEEVINKNTNKETYKL
jgi:hypothetical protein